MPFDNAGFAFDANGPQPERATVPKYPPAQPQVDPNNPNADLQAGALWQQGAPIDLSAYGWQGGMGPAGAIPTTGLRDVTPAGPPAPLPQILNGAAAGSAAPSALSQRLGVQPGQFSAGEVGSNLSPLNAINGTFTANDMDRYIRLGGGQIQDANPARIGIRQATKDEMVRQAQQNQNIGIEQQNVDLTRQKQAYDQSGDRVVEGAVKAGLAAGLTGDALDRLVREAKRAVRQNVGVQNAGPDDLAAQDTVADVKKPFSDKAGAVTDPEAVIQNLYQGKGAPWMAANKEAVLKSVNRDQIENMAKIGLMGRAIKNIGSLPGAGGILPPGVVRSLTSDPRYADAPLLEQIRRMLGMPTGTDERNEFLRKQYLGLQ